ncbi:hypothetical protein SDC9_55897 [bioreactor metagenome]|uniref:Uncharacterized protein n=1 Tax=bioreactor metagenome TaxID=1076179 RepID=A0A644X093_9ZZZZ
MRKVIYLLFLFASVIASGLGIGKTEVQASSLPQIEGTTKTTTAKNVVFSDVLDQNKDGGLIAAHYSHRSHSSHSSHRSHYSSRY